MKAQLRVAGGDSVEEFASLREWLRDEHDLSGRVHSTDRAVKPTDLSGGGLVEVLTVVVGSGGAAATLARSLNIWLQTRRANVTLTVSVGDRSASIQATHVDGQKVDEALALLREVLSDQNDH
jgi:hypothetical protein